MAFEIRQFGDPVLKTRAKEITEFDDSLKRLTERMLQTLRAGEGRMAIAANQVGFLKRVFVAETEGERQRARQPRDRGEDARNRDRP